MAVRGQPSDMAGGAVASAATPFRLVASLLVASTAKSAQEPGHGNALLPSAEPVKTPSAEPPVDTPSAEPQWSPITISDDEVEPPGMLLSKSMPRAKAMRQAKAMMGMSSEAMLKAMPPAKAMPKAISKGQAMRHRKRSLDEP